MKFSRKTGLFMAASSGAILLSLPAIAQEAGTEADESRSVLGDEIVVTANRREESVQDVGISIAAFSGEQLTLMGVDTAGDITQLTPNVEIVRSYASPGFNTQITIRGVGQPDFQDTTEAVVTTYVDEFYMVGAGQSDFMVFDTERAEVARGPQGTIQGRNSTAGSINYYSRKPVFDDKSANASVSVGDHGLVRSTAAVNVGITPNLAVRGALSTSNSEGYVRNINQESPWRTGGEERFRAGRMQLRFQPSDMIDFNFKVELGRMGPTAGGNEEGIQTGPIPGRVGTFRLPTDAYGQSEANIGAGDTNVVNSDGPNELNAKLTHYLGRLDVKASDELSFVAIGGWLKNSKDEIEDCDHTPRPMCLFSNLSESKHWMAEVRANYNKGPFRLVTGANYLKQSLDVVAVTPLFFDAATSPFAGGLYGQYFRDQQDLKSWAVFGQAEFDLTDQLTFIGGARYFKDDKVIDSFDAARYGTIPFSIAKPTTLDEFLAIGQIVLQAPDNTTSLNVANDGQGAIFNKGLVGANAQVNFKPTEDVLLYAAYRRGVKGGGFITGNVDGTAAALREYGEETNNAYEAGWKASMLGGRARFNGAGFYYDYNDMQHTTLIGITNVITNNDTKVWGGELELQANPVDGLDVILGLGYVDSKVYGIANPTGAVPKDINETSKLPLSPKVSGNYLVRYTWNAFNGEPFVQVRGRGRSKMFRDSLNNESNRIGSGHTTDAMIGYTPDSGNWTLTVWLENVFDNRHEVNAFDLSSVGGAGEIVYQRPRWLGGTLSVNF